MWVNVRVSYIFYILYSFNISFSICLLIHLNNLTTTTSCVLLSTVYFIHSCFKTFLFLHPLDDKKRTWFSQNPFFFHLYLELTSRFVLHFNHNIILSFSVEHRKHIMFFIISLSFTCECRLDYNIKIEFLLSVKSNDSEYYTICVGGGGWLWWYQNKRHQRTNYRRLTNEYSFNHFFSKSFYDACSER